MASEELNVARGGCLCGALRFEVNGEPDEILVCHCPDCRRATGAQSVAFIFLAKSAFAMLKGEPRQFASSPDVVRQFCGACGTTISWEGAKQPGRIDVTVGSLDEPGKFVPTRAVYRKHRLPWASEI